MDRKALIRAYKERRRPMGVFRLRNNRNGRYLVGVSVDLTAIQNRHLAQLRMGVHRIRDLQQDWNEMGPGAFTFEVLDTLKPQEQPDYEPASDLKVLEQLWREKLADEKGGDYDPPRTRPQ